MGDIPDEPTPEQVRALVEACPPATPNTGDALPELTMIECTYRREHGGPYSDFFVKMDGRWLCVGADDCYSHNTWEDVTSGYESVTVVARPTATRK